MADNNRAFPPSVRLSPEDREWLAKRAQDEDASVPTLIKRAVKQFRYWQEEGKAALKETLETLEAERSGHEHEQRRAQRLHDMLRDERHRRWEQEKELKDERKLRADYEKQLHDEGNLRVQSERLHDMLRDERNRRWEQEKQLRDERKLRAEREKRLRDERDYYERQAKEAEADGNVRYGPTVDKLLNLAIRSDSDAEAMAAFAKVRALHRRKQSSKPDDR